MYDGSRGVLERLAMEMEMDWGGREAAGRNPSIQLAKGPTSLWVSLRCVGKGEKIGIGHKSQTGSPQVNCSALITFLINSNSGTILKYQEMYLKIPILTSFGKKIPRSGYRVCTSPQ